MKLENCGRCGLEVEVVCEGGPSDDGQFYPALYGCPVAHGQEPVTRPEWNAAQFAARTERVNAAAVALMAARSTPAPTGDIKWDSTGSRHSAVTTGFESVTRVLEMAERLIDAQDAAARVRWAEMQGE